jgi:carnitine 3-dehydrogenase
VASVHDIDSAISSGPGLRWAVMGPTLLFHLGGGDGGLTTFCKRYADSFHRWWDDLGDPRLDDATVARLVEGLGTDAREGIASLAAMRDARLVAVVADTHLGPRAQP